MNIIELELGTDSLVNTALFYSAVVGLKVESADESVSIIAGSSSLKFRKTHQQNPIYHIALNIPCNHIEEALQWSKNILQLIPVSSQNVIADFSDWNARSIYFYDNNKNILEFIARLDLQNPSTRLFSIDSIISISEFGIVSEDVEELVPNFHVSYYLPVYPIQPINANFAAMGDGNGLLVLFKLGRKWFPTEITAGKFDSRIIIS